MADDDGASRMAIVLLLTHVVTIQTRYFGNGADMDDLTTMNPAKLKRRKRSSSSTASVVDLPAVGDLTSGSLLGDDLLPEAGRSESRPRQSSFDLKSDSDSPENGDSSQNLWRNDKLGVENSTSAREHNGKLNLQLANASENENHPLERGENLPRERRSVVELKIESTDGSGSPLDALQADADGKTQPRASRVPLADPNPVVLDHACRSNDQSHNSVRSLAAQKARKKQRVVTAEDASSFISAEKFEETLAMQRDIQTQCLDTLTQLRNTNALNERRYALYLTVGFAILVVVAAIGIFFGVNKQNSAKFQELRFNHEVYKSTLNEKNILAVEYEKEKQGAVAAFEIFKRIENGQLEEAVELFNDTNDSITHPAERALLAHRVDQIRWELAENAFNNGVMLYNAQNYEQARDAFFKSLSLKESTAYAPRLFYFLAMALYQTSDFEGAKRFFARIQPGDLNNEMDANARFYRAVSAEKTGSDAEAYEQFEQFIKKYRYHKLADEAAKRRSKLDPPKN